MTPKCSGWRRDGERCQNYVVAHLPGHHYCSVHSTPEDRAAAELVRQAEAIVALEWARILTSEESRRG